MIKLYCHLTAESNDNTIEISIIDVNKVMVPLAFNAISGRLLYCNNHGLRMSAEAIISSKAELDFHYWSKQRETS